MSLVTSNTTTKTEKVTKTLFPAREALHVLTVHETSEYLFEQYSRHVDILSKYFAEDLYRLLGIEADSEEARELQVQAVLQIDGVLHVAALHIKLISQIYHAQIKEKERPAT